VFVGLDSIGNRPEPVIIIQDIVLIGKWFFPIVPENVNTGNIPSWSIARVSDHRFFSVRLLVSQQLILWDLIMILD
jgi:hypothetical protein